MRRHGLLLLLAAVIVAGCASGPSYVSRSVDDWHNNLYEEKPLLTGIFTDVVPFFPVLKALAFIPDWLVINPVQFWGFDLWRGEGAAFVHENPQGRHHPWIFSEED